MRDFYWPNLSLMDPFHSPINSADVFEEPFNLLSEPFPRPLQGLMNIAPKVDIVESDKNLEVDVEIPGMRKEDLHIRVDSGAPHRRPCLSDL